MNFLDAEAKNRRSSVLLVGALALVLAAVCWALQIRFVGRAALPTSFADLLAHPPLVALAAFALSLAYAAASYWLGGRVVLMSSGARPVDREDPRQRKLVDVAEEIAIAAGVPCPSLWILPDADPNAFATGRDPAHAAVAVTDGLLDALDRDELQAVVAHEIGHVRNRDTLLMLFVTCMLGAVLMLSQILMRTSWRSGSRERRDGAAAGVIAAIVGWILGQVVARIVAMAVSREREYLADATSVELTRNPEALARALRKIDAAAAPTVVAYPATAPLFIEDPAGHPLNDREGVVADLLSTHPPMELRIRRVEAMAFRQLKHERAAAGLDPLAGG